MGQYQQWLHYRHIDQQLQLQKEQLTTALTCLRERMNDLNAHPLAADNYLVQALTLYAKARSLSLHEASMNQPIENGYMQRPEIISQALFEQNRLPNFEQLHATHEAVLPKRPANVHTPLPPTSHKAVDLVPENTNTSSDEQAPTEPQLALPWWLQRAALSATHSNSLDAQSVRTNKLVQRWLERWGRQEEQTQQAANTNGQQAASVQQEGQEP